MSTIEGEAASEAEVLRELFGDGAQDAVQRRIAMALDRGRVDDIMFWLAVQTFVYQVPYGYATALHGTELDATMGDELVTAARPLSPPI